MLLVLLFIGGPVVLAQVWDMSSGTCTQTISKAHSTVVMGLVSWEVRTVVMKCWLAIPRQVLRASSCL